MDKIKCFLLDMDGTLYLGNRPIEGAALAVARMQKQARVLFVTNNSSASAIHYYDKLKNLGFDLSKGDIYGSTRATIDYLKAYHSDKSVYLCAVPEVTAEFAAAGINLVGENGFLRDNPANGLSPSCGAAVPDIVLLTFDKSLTYDKLMRLCGFLDKGALFVVTHPDKVCPTENGFIPDVGSFLKAIKCATGRKPDVVCGKPYKAFGRRITKMTGFRPHEIAMVGDRLSTDFRFAKNCGFISVLVLSGETTADDIQRLKTKPDFVLGSIADWDKRR